MTSSLKTAVVLFNLGGPSGKDAIKPFLFNFFMDKNIIRAPLPVRYLVARLIARKRSRKEAGTSYGHLGDKSPLLENTQAQADALQSVLGDGYKVFINMRYWHPMATEVVGQVAAYAPDRVILLPLYPQFSTTTTRSSLQDWNKAARKAGLKVPTNLICCYPFDDGFIGASADLIRAAYDEAHRAAGRKPRVLFSAHGLPENVIADGDPYQWQCEESARLIATACGIEDLDWSICYQSRVGPLKWIRPSTEEALEKAAHDNVPVIIYPHAFVNEHVETLVEIELEYREKAHELGVPYFARVPTVSVHREFIGGLARLIAAAPGGPAIAPAGGQRLCPAKFRRCCTQEGSVVSSCSTTCCA